MNRNRKVLLDCVLKNRLAIIFFAVMTVLNMVIFFLYGILTEALIYSEILLFVLLLLFFGIDYLSEKKKAAARERNILNLSAAGFEAVDGGTLADADYAAMITALENEYREMKTDFARKRQADDDYYTAWVHQIKTPIAVMQLNLTGDSEENRVLRSELFRIEQYVEMVLEYGRLRSESSDLIIKEYSTDEIIRETLRKFAGQFVMRKLKLNYQPADGTVITDKKWLSFILDQLISNAIKYTPAGEITVSAEGNRITVSDTGIGIAPEDLPRIFEKGYTGMNGRIGQKSSGLGLFLTGKAAKLLNIDIRCESTAGRGSSFILTVPDRNR